MLKQRVLTALALVLVVLLVIIVFPEPLFQAFVMLSAAIGAWEWSKLAGLNSKRARLRYTGVFVLLLFIAQHFIADVVVPVLLLAQLFWILALAFICFYPKYTQLWGSRLFLCFSGLWVLLPFWLAIIYLRSQVEFVFLILMLLALVAAADIGAYFFGRAFGKRKLAVHVSPNKSWEGFWGGALSCSILVAAFSIYYSLNYAQLSIQTYFVLVAVGALLSSYSVVGDLLESMVKRFRNVKDSGNILPGHGGILDRVDGITAAAPIYTLLVISLGEFLV